MLRDVLQIINLFYDGILRARGHCFRNSSGIFMRLSLSLYFIINLIETIPGNYIMLSIKNGHIVSVISVI